MRIHVKKEYVKCPLISKSDLNMLLKSGLFNINKNSCLVRLDKSYKKGIFKDIADLAEKTNLKIEKYDDKKFILIPIPTGKENEI